MRRWCWVGVFLVASCVRSSSVDCPNSTLCPEGTSCKALPSLGTQICAAPGDLGVCDTLADGAACLENGNCHDGVCLHHCGDGIRTGAEECDGADLGKNATCADLGYYDPVPLKCTPDCTYDIVGNYDPAARCTGFCGDNEINGAELCEDSLGWADQRGCVDFGFEAGPVGCSRCGPEFSDCHYIGWRLNGDLPRPVGHLHGRSHDDIWVITDAPRAFHYDGVHWTEHSPPVAQPSIVFQAVYVDDAGDAWIVDSTRTLWHWHGTAWTSSTISGAGTSLPSALWMTSNGTGWAVGSGGKIFSIVGGVATTLGSSPTSTDLTSVWGSSASNVWAVGAGTLLHYDGSSWQSTTSPTGAALLQVTGSSASDVWIVGLGNVLFHNTGSGWTAVTAPRALPAGEEYVLWTSGLDDVWLASTDVSPNQPTAFHYDGARWIPMAIPRGIPRTLWGSKRGDLWFATDYTLGAGGRVYNVGGAAWGVWLPNNLPVTEVDSLLFDGSVLWAGGFGGLAEYHTSAWTMHAAPTDVTTLVGLWSSGGSDIWAANNGSDIDQNPFGEIDHYTGSSLVVAYPTPGPVRTVWGASATDVWAGGDRYLPDAIFHLQGSWSSVSTPSSTAPVTAMTGFGPSDIWAATNNGELLHYNGSAWSTVYDGGTTEAFSGLWGSGPSNIWAVGEKTMHYDGSTWTAVPTTERYQQVCGTNASDVFAVGANHAMGHFDGTSWSHVRLDPQSLGFGPFADAITIACSARHVFVSFSGGGMVDLERTIAW